MDGWMDEGELQLQLLQHPLHKNSGSSIVLETENKNVKSSTNTHIRQSLFCSLKNVLTALQLFILKLTYIYPCLVIYIRE